mgnify:CR=1 FL=1
MSYDKLKEQGILKYSLVRILVGAPKDPILYVHHIQLDDSRESKTKLLTIGKVNG